MKILAIADRPPSRPVKTILAETKIDLICTLGDLGHFELHELETINTIPKIGVYGNHCSGKYFEGLGIKNMHLQTWEYQGLTFGGFEGSVRYNNRQTPMYTQEEATALMKDFPKVDVLLAHCPPYGINDDASELSHTGFIALRDYLDRHSPRYFFHGHTYPDAASLITSYKNTNIIYVYQDKIIEIT